MSADRPELFSPLEQKVVRKMAARRRRRRRSTAEKTKHNEGRRGG